MNSLQKLYSKTAIANYVNKSARRRFADAVKPETTAAKATASGKNESQYFSPTSALGDVHKVDTMDRYFLVWTKKFPSKDKVPAYVSRDTMEKTRNIMRIRINLSIIGLVLVGSFTAAQMGKKAASRGESVVKNNLDWHAKYNSENTSNNEEGGRATV